jgi:hypothetical protein
VPDADEYRILFWPVAEPEAFIQGTYLSVPEDNLPASLNVPGSTIQCPPMYAQAAVESILAAAEASVGVAGPHDERFQVALRNAIQHDAATGGAYDFSKPVRKGYGIGEILPIQFEP